MMIDEGLTTPAQQRRNARMQSPQQKIESLTPVVIGTDPGSTDWHPGKLEKAKLEELQARMMRLRRLGGPFAGLSFSPDAETRMSRLGVFHTGSPVDAKAG